jgi:sRNA-binding regulator protein Hfq
MAGNPNKIWGKTFITVDGLLLETEGKGSIKPGGPHRTAVDGDHRAGYFTETTKHAEVECTVLLTGGVSLTELQAIDNATVVVEADSGQLLVVRNAYVSGEVSASEGKAKVTFMGPPAEEEV